MSSESSPSKDKSYTQDWLETILETYYSIKHPSSLQQLQVTEWDIKPVEGDGYLSEMLSLDVKYCVDGEEQRAQLVAKLLPPDPYNRAFVIQTQFDLREIKFYTEVAPALEEVTRNRLQDGEYQPLPIPNHYHAVYKEDAESILVMEDLRSKGFSHQNLNKGLTMSQAEAAVDALAQIHSSSVVLESELKVELGTKYPYLLSKERAEEAFHALFEKGLPLLLKYIQKKPEFSSIRNCLQEYPGNRSRDIFQRALAPSDKLNTLVHCDFWSSNLMFKMAENETFCRVLDWQMIMHGKPAIDLGMLITTSLTPQTRRDHEETIVNLYWNSFLKRIRKLGIKDKDLTYTYNDLRADLIDGKLFGALVMVGSVDIALGDPEREDRVLSLIKDLIQDGSL